MTEEELKAMLDKVLVDLKDYDKRTMSRLDKIENEQEGLNRELSSMAQQDVLARLSGGRSESHPLASQKFGFDNLGDLAKDIRSASMSGATPSDRIRELSAAATNIGTEGTGADGGVLVPPDFSSDIMKDEFADDGILGRCDITTVTGNSYVQPTDETVPWGSTGIQAYWENETNTLTDSKPSLKTNIQRLGKITALVPVSDELLEDSLSLSSYLQRKVREIFSFKIALAIVQGNGTGQPLGIMNAGCLKSVAKEGGQAADTLIFENIANMEAAMLGQHRKNAVWLAHSTVLPQLRGMYIAAGTGGIPVYMPGNNMSGTPYNTLAGMPIIFTEACEPLGDAGDIISADLSQYRVIMKSSGMKQDVSMHVWFDQGLTAFRFVMRISGQPWRSSVITGRDGSTEYSPFVALADRE